MGSILVADADPKVRDRLAQTLRDLGHDVSETSTAAAALTLMQRNRPDLVVCDYSLPDLPGHEFLADVRGHEELKSIRVLAMSSRDAGDDIRSAFEGGADDFIGKPIDRDELTARVGACLRRPAVLSQAREIKAGGIAIDSVGHRVAIDGSYVSLAPREYRLLLFLLGNQDRVFSRKQLLMHVWDRDVNVGPRTVDVHIRRLRSLLEPFGYQDYVQTVRGSGYRFSLES